jgi:hypothetical protein
MGTPITTGKWARATWLGWILGVPVVILFAFIGEALRIGGSQVLIGLGMGTSVGVLQGLAIRRLIGRAAPWIWSSVIGLALPFLAADLLRASGRTSFYSIEIAVAAAGVIVGAWQAILLRPYSDRAWMWVVANVIGWTLAALTVYAADSQFRAPNVGGLVGALLYLGTIAAGGLLLGLVTGVALTRVLTRTSRSK